MPALSQVQDRSALAPFGIMPGAQVEDYGGNPQQFSTSIEPPAPHSEFRRYLVHQTQQTGICLILATTSTERSPIVDDNTGVLLMEQFDRIQTQIEGRYGPARFSQTWSLFPPGEKWIEQIATGNRHYNAVWREPENADGIDEILMSIRSTYVANRTWLEGDFDKPYSRPSPWGRPYISLRYTFDNYDECIAIRDGRDTETSEQDASTF